LGSVKKVSKKGRPFLFKRKIRTSGGASAITIPPEIMTNLGWKLGDELDLEVYLEEGIAILRRTGKN